MRNLLVQMMATSFFTRNSPTTGAILHGDDREQADVLARFPRVSADDADFLEGEKLAKRYDGKVPDEVEGGGPAAGTETVGERAARVMEDHADADAGVDGPTGLDTRATTAFERPVEQLAGGGRAVAMEADDGVGGPADEEDAPASGKGKGKASGSKPDDK